MINLLYESLPNSITVGDKDFLINTDFKYWIELSDALNNQDCDKTYLTNVILNLFVDEIPNQFNSEVFMAIKSFLMEILKPKILMKVMKIVIPRIEFMILKWMDIILLQHFYKIIILIY